jgi:integrase
MPRSLNRLTTRFVNTAPIGRHADGGGLYLLNDGTRRWIFMFAWHARRQEMGLGPLTDVSLAEARDLAQAARAQVKAGINPINARRLAQQQAEASVAARTFGEFVLELLEDRLAGFHEKTVEAWHRTFKGVHGNDPYAQHLLGMAPQDISTDDVLKVLRPIWLAKPNTAGKVRNHLEAMLAAATAKGLRSPDKGNPAVWRGHLKALLAERPAMTRGHQRALPYEDLPRVWPELMAMRGVAPRALAWTILTVVRESVTLGMPACEIDRGSLTWTIPKDRMKGRAGRRREHRVPLTPGMLAILDEVGAPTEGTALVFPSPSTGGEMSNASMDAVCDRLGIDATPHGFRSTFRDWAGDCTDFPEELAEHALAHAVGSTTERAYRRRDAFMRRRKLMEAWELFVTTPPSVKVVPINSRAS